jgi:hypothetical protein
MMDKSYKAELSKIKSHLAAFEISLFTGRVNLLMKGELSDWNNDVPLGMEVQIDNSLLEASEDENIKGLLNLQEKLKETVNKLG